MCHLVAIWSTFRQKSLPGLARTSTIVQNIVLRALDNSSSSVTLRVLLSLKLRRRFARPTRTWTTMRVSCTQSSQFLLASVQASHHGSQGNSLTLCRDVTVAFNGQDVHTFYFMVPFKLIGTEPIMGNRAQPAQARVTIDNGHLE